MKWTAWFGVYVDGNGADGDEHGPVALFEHEGDAESFAASMVEEDDELKVEVRTVDAAVKE